MATGGVGRGSGGGPRASGGHQRGTVIDGRYEIRDLLGRGGQGDVYLAYDRNFAIEVAIKFLHPDYRTDEFMERFRVDAQATVRLSHPNVVRVYDFNPQYPYMVMEYCGDGDLDRYIKSRKRHSLRELLDIVRQVCEGLAEAHEHNPPILHRDIKPGNVLFKGTTPKLTDFGLAKMLREGGGLTTTHGMMGTVRYCSPQQLRDASKVDHRADIWSLGVVLFELLAWIRPFDRGGDDQFQIMRKIDVEPPQEPPYALPGPVREVIHRSLEKDPARRFASAREMGRAVKAALDAVPGAETLLLPPENVVDEICSMASQVADLMSRGQSQEAATIVSRIRKMAPEDSIGRYWNKQVKHLTDSGSGDAATPATPATTDWRTRVESLVAAGDFRAARKVVGERIVDADDTEAQDELQRITEAERQFKQVLDRGMAQAEQARSAGDPERVVAIWAGVSELYPKHATVQAEVAQAAIELKAAERRALLKRTLEAAREKVAAGDPASAIDALRGYLREDPGSVEVQAEIRAIQQEMERRAAAARLAALQESVARLRQAGDLAGAIEACDTLLQKEPGVSEAVRLRAALAAEAAAGRRAEARDRLETVAGQVRALVAAGRYRGVPSQDDAVRRALQEAAAANDGEPAAIDAARAALVTVRNDAERALARGVAAARSGLLDRFRAGREWLERPDASDGSAAVTARRDLGEALLRALAAMTAPSAPGPAEDPMEPLAEAVTRLDSSIEAVARDHRAALDAVLSRARADLAGAETEVAAVAALLRAEPSGAARAERLEQLLERLRGLVESGAPRQIESAAGSCRALQAEAEAARIAVEARSRRAIEDALGEATPLLAAVPEGRLPELVRRGAALMEGDADGGDDVSQRYALAAQIREEAAAARTGKESRLKEIASRWEAALKGWKALLARDLGSGLAGEGRRTTEAGAAALAAMRAEDLAGWTAVLEALTRRYRLESAWIDQGDAIAAIERGATDEDAAAGDGPSGGSGLLKKYRAAVARGDFQEISSLAREIDKLSGGRPAQERSGRRAEIPAIGAAMRRLNARLAPEALAAFDALAGRLRDAQGGRGVGSARDAATLEAAHRRLLRPVPAWKRPGLAAALAIVVMGVAAAAVAVPRSRYTVTVMSLAGEARVREVLREGTPVTGLATSVPEAGVRWERLRPGRYLVRMQGGAERQFSVPDEPVVLLPAGTGNISTLVADELGL